MPSEFQIVSVFSDTHYAWQVQTVFLGIGLQSQRFFWACSHGGCLLGAAPAEVAGLPVSSDVPGMDLFPQMSLAWALSHGGRWLGPAPWVVAPL